MQFYRVERPSLTLKVIDNNSKEKTSRITAQALQKLRRDGLVVSDKLEKVNTDLRKECREVDEDIYVVPGAESSSSAHAISWRISRQ